MLTTRVSSAFSPSELSEEKLNNDALLEIEKLFCAKAPPRSTALLDTEKNAGASSSLRSGLSSELPASGVASVLLAIPVAAVFSVVLSE